MCVRSSSHVGGMDARCRKVVVFQCLRRHPTNLNINSDFNILPLIVDIRIEQVFRFVLLRTFDSISYDTEYHYIRHVADVQSVRSHIRARRLEHISRDSSC